LTKKVLLKAYLHVQFQRPISHYIFENKNIMVFSEPAKFEIGLKCN